MTSTDGPAVVSLGIAGPLVALEAQTMSGSVQVWDAAGTCVYSAPTQAGVRAVKRLSQLLVHGLQALPDDQQAQARLACLRGPGGFTGLRLSAFSVRALAWEAGLPICGVDHLQALAAPLQELAQGQRVFVAVALKKDTTFIACYAFSEQGMEMLLAPVAVADATGPDAAMLATIGSCQVACGPAWLAKRSVLDGWWTQAHSGVPASQEEAEIGAADGEINDTASNSAWLLATDQVTPYGVGLVADQRLAMPWQEFLPHYGQASAAELQLAARQSG